jgi:hypothetical protein
MKPTITTTQTTEVQLEPKLVTKLTNELAIYAELEAELELSKQALDAQKSKVTQLAEQTGEKSFGVNGHKVTLVEGTTSSLDKKKLIALGVTTAMLEEATVTKPKKAYWLITTAGSIPF